MSDLLTEALPTVWHGQAIDPDFRHMVWLCNTYRRGAGDDPLALACRAIRRFYREPGPLLETAQACSEWYQHLIEFYQAGETATERSSARSSGAAATLPFDYHCDAAYIIAGFQRLYGIDLTTEHVHWFRFRALLHGVIGEDCMFSRIIDWRTADLTGKPPEERRFYEEKRELFALPSELRGGAVVAETVDEHNSAFIARFRSR